MQGPEFSLQYSPKKEQKMAGAHPLYHEEMKKNMQQSKMKCSA
jgi:hypothetical protein